MLKYISKRGKTIEFDAYEYDNYTDEDYDFYWVDMCKHHHNKYRGILGNRCDDAVSGVAICSVKGCDRTADYYVDFNPSEVVERSE